MVSIAAAAAAAMLFAQSVPEGAPAPDSSYENVMLHQYFEADGDGGQCDARQHGKFVTLYDEWSEPIRIDTDDRPGGCQFNIAVVDRRGALSGWSASWAFRATADGGQCGNQGIQSMQVVRADGDVSESRAVRIDTDNRAGGCVMDFSVNGRGPSLLIYFVSDDEGSGQCGRDSDVQVVRPGQSAHIVIDTDNRPGGCLLAFRLR